LSSRFPALDVYGHDSGHLWHTLLGLKGDPHFDILHIASTRAIVGGFILLSASWRILYQAQRSHELATTGPYAYVRHPQYVGFIVIMLGFLLQWPTIPTLVMFPILVTMYARLARKEEQEVLHEFGQAYAQYMKETPAFIPKMFGRTPRSSAIGRPS
jgi:protein-S-isoprenylcysteine O-methyltransferase Ste14